MGDNFFEESTFLAKMTRSKWHSTSDVVAPSSTKGKQHEMDGIDGLSLIFYLAESLLPINVITMHLKTYINQDPFTDCLLEIFLYRARAWTKNVECCSIFHIPAVDIRITTNIVRSTWTQLGNAFSYYRMADAWKTIIFQLNAENWDTKCRFMTHVSTVLLRKDKWPH